MTFRVDENALDRAADTVVALAPDVSAAMSYASAHVVLHGRLGDSGIFVNAIGVLDEVRGALDDELARLRDLTEASGSELRATASTYRRTDDATTARMDRLLGRARRGVPQ